MVWKVSETPDFLVLNGYERKATRTNAGEVIIIDYDTPEDETKRILISPFITPKHGKGDTSTDEYSEKLAYKLVEFLNINAL